IVEDRPAAGRRRQAPVRGEGDVVGQAVVVGDDVGRHLEGVAHVGAGDDLDGVDGGVDLVAVADGEGDEAGRRAEVAVVGGDDGELVDAGQVGREGGVDGGGAAQHRVRAGRAL